MKVHILTLFPEYFASPLAVSIVKRALDNHKVEIAILNIRDFAQDKHKVTDDRPFGGGAGMVLKVEPIDLALQSLGIQQGEARSKIVVTSAKGSLFTQQDAQAYAELDRLVLICGHYEGVDERVVTQLADEEKRIGDYVLTGGEAAAMVMTEALVRLIPGVVGNPQSLEGESHDESGMLGVPQYTRPAEYRGWKVPEVLISGDHQQIEQWRASQRKQKEPKG